VSHYSLFLPKAFFIYTLALLTLCTASLTLLSGCGDSLPPKPSEASTSSTSQTTNTPVSSQPDAPPTSGSPADASSVPAQATDAPAGEVKSPNTAHVSAKQLVEQDIIMLASNGIDPFSIAMHVKPSEVKKDDVEALSPYYQALVGISPLVTVKVVKVEKPTVDPLTGTYPGFPAPVVVDPTIAMQDALSTINVNGISYKRTSPMAILSLASKDSSGSTSLFVKKGSRLFVNGYSVLVEDITTSTVRVSTSQGVAKVTKTLMIQDIFGFARSGATGGMGASTTTGTSPSSPSAGGAAPSAGTGAAQNVSSQDIDKIVKDLLN
jgi:hypothetical protein